MKDDYGLVTERIPLRFCSQSEEGLLSTFVDVDAMDTPTADDTDVPKSTEFLALPGEFHDHQHGITKTSIFTLSHGYH